MPEINKILNVKNTFPKSKKNRNFIQSTIFHKDLTWNQFIFSG